MSSGEHVVVSKFRTQQFGASVYGLGMELGSLALYATKAQKHQRVMDTSFIALSSSLSILAKALMFSG